MVVRFIGNHFSETFYGSEEADNSRDRMPLPIPERVESLGRSRVIVSDGVTSGSGEHEER